MQYDCALLRAQIDLVKKDPSLLPSQGKFTYQLHVSCYHSKITHLAEPLLPPALAVMRLTSMNLYEQALTTARALDVDMTDIFAQLTTHCLRLTRNRDSVS